MAVFLLHLFVTHCKYILGLEQSHPWGDSNPVGFNLQPMGPRDLQAAFMGL